MDEAFVDISGFIAQLKKISDHAPKEIQNEIDEALADADREYLEKELPDAISQSQEGVKRVRAWPSVMI